MRARDNPSAASITGRPQKVEGRLIFPALQARRAGDKRGLMRPGQYLAKKPLKGVLAAPRHPESWGWLVCTTLPHR